MTTFRDLIIATILICALLTLAGCMKCSDADDKEAKAAWQQYKEARQTKDKERTLAVIDSMETAEVVSTAEADYMRGIAYDQGWQMQIAEHYYRKAHESYRENPSQNWHIYADAGYRWAYLRFMRGDTEGALAVISSLSAQAEGNQHFPKNDQADMLMLLADIQMELHQFDEARKNWQKAYEVQQTISMKTDQKADLPWISMNISANLFEIGDIEGAQEWLERCAEEFARFEQVCNDSMLIEEWKGHIALKQAMYLQAKGYAAEAAAIFASIPRTQIFEPRGYNEAADYLMAAGHYDEAAYWYEQIDSTYVTTDGAKMTFDIVAHRLSPRYRAYRQAGRDENALMIADSISAAIDSALVWQKKNDAAELAVIYQTHERDLQLKDLRFSVSLHRIVALAAILIILLIGFLLWRAYNYNKVLAEKNRRLVAEIEQRELEEQQAIKHLKAEPAEALTAQQQLYSRICDLMNSSDRIYTDADLDRSRLAQLLGTNEHYVSDAISACCNGKSVSGFLNEYRLRYAAHLLANSTDSVALIAELCGFARSSFFRIFSDAYGMSPSEYRKAASAK